MKHKISIRNESIRISNRSDGESAAQHRFNSRSDSLRSNHNDISVNTKIRIILAAFILLEILDAALTFFGISQRGLFFEKNLFARNFIASFGFLPVAAIKVFASAAFAFMINYLYGRFEKCKKYLFYLSILLSLIAFYGAGSSVYVLFVVSMLCCINIL